MKYCCILHRFVIVMVKSVSEVLGDCKYHQFSNAMKTYCWKDQKNHVIMVTCILSYFEVTVTLIVDSEVGSMVLVLT